MLDAVLCRGGCREREAEQDDAERCGQAERDHDGVSILGIAAAAVHSASSTYRSSTPGAWTASSASARV